MSHLVPILDKSEGWKALVHKPAPLTTPVLWLVCLSCLFLAGVRDFTYLCFVAAHPLPNAQPIPLVVRESLRPTKDLSENFPDCLPPLLAECLCGIKLVFLVGMGPGSEIRAAQKGQDCGRLNEMGYTLRNGRSLTSPSPGGRKKAIRSRSGSIFPKVCPGHRCWGFFQTQSTGEERKEGRLSVPTDIPEVCSPLAGCQHATDDHLLCPGLGEKDTITTLAHKDSPEGIRKWSLWCSPCYLVQPCTTCQATVQ